MISPRLSKVSLTDCHNDRKVKRNCPNIASTNSDILACIRISPRSEICSTAHRTRNSPVVNKGVCYHIMLRITPQREPIGIHTLRGTFDSLSVNLFGIQIVINLFFIKQVDQLRKHDLFSPMPLHSSVQHDGINKTKDITIFSTQVFPIELPKSNRSESKVTTRARNGIYLKFHTLKPLSEFSSKSFPHKVLTLSVIQGVLLIEFSSSFHSLLAVRQKNLIEFCKGEPTELLSRSNKSNITDNLKGTKDTIGFCIGRIGHLKATLQDSPNIKETTVDRPQDHISEIMNIDVTSLGEFLFFFTKIELLIESLSEIPTNKTTFGRTKRAIKVSILLVSQEENIISFFLKVLKFLHVGVLIVSIFLIGFRNLREVLKG